jgi:aminopeptidase N
VTIGENYQRRQIRVDGVTVRFHHFAAPQARTPPVVTTQIIRDALSVFADQFGPYPLTEFDVVEVPISIGGYEFPGMVYVDDRLRISGELVDYRYIIAHEVAHQWWYGLVNNNSIREPWLDESLASYSASIYLEQVEGKASGEALLDYWRRTYGTRSPQDPPINSSALEFSNWATYRAPVYYHGALFLDALRQEMGDELFFLLLKLYADNYHYRSATTEDFLRMVEAVACRDLDPLFSRWFALDAEIRASHCYLSSLSDPGVNAQE